MPDPLAGNFEQAMRWMQQLWGPGGDPAAAMRAGPAGMPGLRPEEYERRIADLRSVERWLDLHLSMIRTTIQTMEMQRSALAAWQQMTSSPPSAGAGAAPGAMPGAMPGSPAAGDPAAAFQPQAWWNSVQEQFQRLAAAAAAPPPGTAASPAPSQAAPKDRPGKP